MLALRFEDVGDGAKDEFGLGDQVNPDLIPSLLVFVETTPGGPVRIPSLKEYIVSNTGPDDATVIKFAAPLDKDVKLTVVLPAGG